MSTQIEVRKDGTRFVDHLVDDSWTHPDSDVGRASCKVCSVSEARRHQRTQIKPHALDSEAEQLVADGAKAEAFESLRKRGWKDLSHRQPSRTADCGEECWICNPPPVRRAHKKGMKR